MRLYRGTQLLVAKLFYQIECASKAADLVNEVNGVIGSVSINGNLRLLHRRSTYRRSVFRTHRAHISDTSLRWTSVSPSI